MQDLQSIHGGATGRIFGLPGGGGAVQIGGGVVAAGGVGVAGAVDRRLRPHPQQNLRCPRCDSLNTKFCYYNNYNLSQPRHFCKSCRRYWTKGGVLRNVPVGGGCRKSKRSSSSKPSKSSHDSKDTRRAPAAAASHSSSDSSSLTAANAADAPAVTQEPGTPPPALDSYASALLEPINGGAAPPTAADVFPETASFTSLIAAAPYPDLLGLNFTNASQFHLLPLQQPKTVQLPQPRLEMVGDEMKLPGIPVTDRYIDHIAHMDVLPPPHGRSAAGPPLTALDWQGSVDVSVGLFDVAAASVAGDHGGYWNQSLQWGEIDPSLFLP